MDEIQKIRSMEQISLWDALKKHRSGVREVGSMQSLHRFRGKFQRQIIDSLSKELQIIKIQNKYMWQQAASRRYGFQTVVLRAIL